ncbi:hypothetical protein B9Q04_02300 [Candidatus Marsarchaeota G2 archaeon BE_D]|uniref:FAD-binding FR-type domain-containing protein n=1 Tax=Candidatus Marsarchaeota G2 archaeon BE_D TaxID=1978158 RepID=A0A2R6CDU9_9ARCH|nr:MAG: hypothetical protein B9Q04_02300 [Candidatus Marsarchaeota G2 archaeon BE_D]
MQQKHHEYKLRLAHVETEAPTIKTFVFDTSGLGFKFTAGEYVKVVLEGVVGDPRGNQREFSISSPATRSAEYMSITTTIEPSDSPYKNRLNSLKPGDQATVIGPLGRFTLEGLNDNAEVVMIAGGIGITPFRSIILTELASWSSRSITLMYSAKNPENLVFRHEFDELSAAHPNFKAHYTITRPTAAEVREHVGRIDAEYVRSLTHPEKSVYYVAGPPTMVQELSEQLAQKLSVSRDQIRTEKFTGY